MITIYDIKDKLGDPLDAYDRAQSNSITENSFYLYELQEMFNFSEAKTWFFNDLNEFFDFAYSHELFEYINMEEYEEEHEAYYKNTDLSELYSKLVSYKDRVWKVEDCKEFVNSFQHSSFELIEFGNVSDLLNASDDVVQKCKKYYSSKEELLQLNLNQGFYQIMHEYLSQFDEHPKINKEQFLDFLQDS